VTDQASRFQSPTLPAPAVIPYESERAREAPAESAYKAGIRTTAAAVAVVVKSQITMLT